MKNTKIEWCDATWNPVTGCLHGCKYCYARKIAERFKGCDEWTSANCIMKDGVFETFEDTPPLKDKHVAPYPFGFKPTLHRRLLNQPSKWRKPKRIFVCSMADLFGDWVPDEWIEMIFDVCRRTPQHTYLFLTKNPDRYCQMAKKGKLPKKSDMPNLWFGTTITKVDEGYFFSNTYNSFLSIEPIQSEFPYTKNTLSVDWVIAGAETGNKKDKYVPSKECVLNIVSSCYMHAVPLFMKDSLIPIVGEEHMRRQIPRRLQN